MRKIVFLIMMMVSMVSYGQYNKKFTKLIDGDVISAVDKVKYDMMDKMGKYLDEFNAMPVVDSVLLVKHKIYDFNGNKIGSQRWEYSGYGCVFSYYTKEYNKNEVVINDKLYHFRNGYYTDGKVKIKIYKEGRHYSSYYTVNEINLNKPEKSENVCEDMYYTTSAKNGKIKAHRPMGERTYQGRDYEAEGRFKASMYNMTGNAGWLF